MPRSRLWNQASLVCNPMPDYLIIVSFHVEGLESYSNLRFLLLLLMQQMWWDWEERNWRFHDSGLELCNGETREADSETHSEKLNWRLLSMCWCMVASISSIQLRWVDLHWKMLIGNPQEDDVISDLLLCSTCRKQQQWNPSVCLVSIHEFLRVFFLVCCFSGALIAQATSDFCRFMATRTSRQEHHQSNCWADLWATTKVVKWSNRIHKERMMMANTSYHQLLPPNSLPSLGQIFLWVSALSLLTKSWNSPADGFCLSTTTWNKKWKRESCNIVEYSRVDCWLYYLLHSLWNTKVLTLVGFHHLLSEIGTLQSIKFPHWDLTWTTPDVDKMIPLWQWEKPKCYFCH